MQTLMGLLCQLKVKYNVETFAAIQCFKLHNFKKELDVLKNILEIYYSVVNHKYNFFSLII